MNGTLLLEIDADEDENDIMFLKYLKNIYVCVCLD